MMTRFHLIVIPALLLFTCVNAELNKQDRDSLTEIIDSAVMIQTENGTGSGNITNVNGTQYVVTAGHVLTYKNGKFADVIVVKYITENGKRVGCYCYSCEVIRYSPPEAVDIAILRVYKTEVTKNRIKFNGTLPELGSKIINVGSPFGQRGYNSVMFGTYSQYDRRCNDTTATFDEIAYFGHKGHSGSGVFNENGEYIGMVVRKHEEGLILITPMRSILEWARRADIEFIFRNDLPAKPVEEVKKGKIEVV